MKKSILFLSILQAAYGQAVPDQPRTIHVLTAGPHSMLYFQGNLEVEPPSSAKPPTDLLIRAEGEKPSEQAAKNMGISVNASSSFVYQGSPKFSMVFGKMVKNQPVTNTVQVSTEGMKLPLLIISPEAKTMNWDRLEVHPVDLAALGQGDRKVFVWNLSKLPVLASFENEKVSLAAGERKVLIMKDIKSDMMKYKAGITMRNGSIYVLANSSYTLNSGSVLVALFLDVRTQGANAPVDLRFYPINTKKGAPVP